MSGMKNVRVTGGLLVMSVVLSACFAKSSGPAAINSKEYRCEELRALVTERQAVKLRGFLGTQGSVYASAKSCDVITEEALPSSWRTKDVFACLVGFRCQDIIGKEDFSGV